MNCAEARGWLHLYIDGRLSGAQLIVLERHLETCHECLQERQLLETLSGALAAQEMVSEPEQLSRQIMARVAAFEARRVVAHARAALQVRDIALRVGVICALILLTVEIIQPSLWTSLVSQANHNAPQVLQALTAPGPNSVAWSIWALGGAAVLIVATRIIRSGAYSSWLRSVTERLPQLW